MTQLVEANKKSIENLPPKQISGLICESVTMSARVFEALKERDLLLRYWTSGSPDNFLALLRSDSEVLTLTGSDILVSLVQELLCLAFLKGIGRTLPYSSIDTWRAAHRFMLDPIYPAIKDIRQQRAERVHEVHCQKHRSADQDKETLCDITPAEKMRVLRNGIYAVNAQGFLNSENEIRSRRLKFDRPALDAAERFFVVNPAWSARHLISLMVRADGMDSESSNGQYDEYWHSRKASDLRFLLCNLDPVLQDFNMVDQMPPFQPIDKAVLFPKKTKAVADSAEASRSVA